MEEKDELTGQIIGAAIEEHRTLGPGLLESIYEEPWLLTSSYEASHSKGRSKLTSTIKVMLSRASALISSWPARSSLS
jgi:hypothetical protein